jgi:hypothetical protein
VAVLGVRESRSEKSLMETDDVEILEVAVRIGSIGWYKSRTHVDA